MRQITMQQFQNECRAQGVPMEHLAFRCPACGTIQSAFDFIKAGAGKTFNEGEAFLGYACIGRVTHAMPPPRQKGMQAGCDWTLGGFFKIHELEVITPGGVSHPRFALATPEAAQRHRDETLAASSTAQSTK
jgi:hypothetical protein